MVTDEEYYSLFRLFIQTATCLSKAAISLTAISDKHTGPALKEDVDRDEIEAQLQHITRALPTVYGVAMRCTGRALQQSGAIPPAFPPASKETAACHTFTAFPVTQLCPLLGCRSAGNALAILFSIALSCPRLEQVESTLQKLIEYRAYPGIQPSYTSSLPAQQKPPGQARDVRHA